MPKRLLEGNVVSTKQDKTITVLVERRFMHPMYKKYVRRTDKYAAHDEHNAFNVGDRVQIEECRPISRRKAWTVVSKPTNTSRSPSEETNTTAKKTNEPSPKDDGGKASDTSKTTAKKSTKKAEGKE